MDTKRSFEDLDVWKLARAFKKKIRILSDSFPAEEKLRLKSQLIRASRSVTANIAEGWGRYHLKENIQFCRIARGSLFETLDHLIEAKDDDYISEAEFESLKEELNICIKVLNGYIAYLQKSIP